MKKDAILRILVFIAGIILSSILWRGVLNRHDARYNDLIIQKDSLTQVTEGNYAKLVNDHKVTKRDLRKAVSKNTTLDSIIRSQNEDILTYEQLVITLEEKTDTVIIHTDTIKIDSLIYVEKTFDAYYPDSTNWFIGLHGIRS